MTIRFRIAQWLAYFFRSVLWALNLLLVVYTLLGYWLLYALPTEHWLAGMIMISLPVAWVLNVGLLIFWLTTRAGYSWLSGLTLVVGVVLFGSRTFVYHARSANAGAARRPPGAFSVLSYNVHSFGFHSIRDWRVSSPRPRRTIHYVLHHPAPIKCFQELAIIPRLPDYDLVRRFSEAGYPHSVLLHPPAQGSVGLAIFSRFPVLQSGREPFRDPENGVNGIIWADVRINNDTIRIINVHLQSMGIRVGRVLRQEALDGVKHETRGVLSALRYGFIERREQVRRVEQYVRSSPYPVIVTGDHNDTPYSVVYERLRRMLPNSFEDAGRGFGFTYNRAPGFIRIDHQFHDSRLTALDFETVHSVRYSDHYPIVGTYQRKSE